MSCESESYVCGEQGTLKLSDVKRSLRCLIVDHLASLLTSIEYASGSSGSSSLYGDFVNSLLVSSDDLSRGDLSLPCFSLSKVLRKSPPYIATALQSNWTALPEVESVKAVGPFLNIYFNRFNFICKVLDSVFDEKLRIFPKKETVLIEYSSPNIAKPFHVGHLRATLIGNCLDRVYSALGYRIISINHLGDWGTQFGFVWAGCKIWGTPTEAVLSSLVGLYRRATTLRVLQEKGEKLDESWDSSVEYPDVNELARKFFVDLENGETYAIDFWQWCLDVSLDYFRATYKRLGIEFDYYTGESFYSDKLQSVRFRLEGLGLLKESQGALGIDLSVENSACQLEESDNLGFARVFAEDGRSLYLTRDIAAAYYRAETFNFDRALYVVGAPQALHFKQLIASLKLMGLPHADNIEHIAFGHVLGMKTRGGGEIVELNQFLEEAIAVAAKVYSEDSSKRPDNLDESLVTEKVALAAIVFSTLSKTRIKDIAFNWKHALELQGDTGPYLLYAYARLNGLIEKAKESHISLAHFCFTDFKTSEVLSELGIASLSCDEGYGLLLKVDEFTYALERTVLRNEPSELAGYALELAKCISKSYLTLRVLGEELPIARARLLLFEAARRVLYRAIELLGVCPVDRM